MLKNISQLECVIEGKVFRLLCDHDSPLNHAKEALFQFQKYIGHIEDQIRLKQEELKNQEKIEKLPEGEHVES